MKETSLSPHTGSEPFTLSARVKNRYSVLARGRFSPARLAKTLTLGNRARVDRQTAVCRAGTGTDSVPSVGFRTVRSTNAAILAQIARIARNRSLSYRTYCAPIRPR